MNMSCSRVDNHCQDMHVCPVNGRVSAAVNHRTVLHHVKSPRARQIPVQGYYFCTDPDCGVMYFGEDDRILGRDYLRSAAGQNARTPGRPMCYCFGLRANDALVATAGIARKFVIDHTRPGSCDCAIRKPAGRCCLKALPDQ